MSSARVFAVVLAWSLAVVFASAPRMATAQDAFHCIDQLSDDEVRFRTRYIEEQFRSGKRKSASWRYGWMTGFFLIGAFETLLALDAHDSDEKWDRFGYAYLGAGAYFIGLSHLILPAPRVWGLKRIRKQPRSTEAERREKLRYATKTLKKAAALEEFMMGPLSYGSGVIYGVVGGSVKAAKWTGKTRGLTALMFLGPTVLITARNLTGDMHASLAYEEYRGIACSSKYYEKSQEGADLDFSLNPMNTYLKVKF